MACEASPVLEVAPDAFCTEAASPKVIFGMTGCVLAGCRPEAAIRSWEKLAQNLYICAPHMAQQAALARLPTNAEICEAGVTAFQADANFLLPGLALTGLHKIPINALRVRFFTFTRICSNWGGQSDALCQHLIEANTLR